MSRRAKGEYAGVPVVGIGASAGGVEALGRFFDAMPTDSGLAFVIVLHLDPTHESQMASVLGSHTAMPVVDIADGMRIESNRVYVIVPDRSLTVRGERLRLAKPAEARGHRYPVDVLFSSLAIDRHERMIAIVLSGTGSNGTHGLQEVKANGGLILVQDPETAQFDDMPRSAIAAGVAASLRRECRRSFSATSGTVTWPRQAVSIPWRRTRRRLWTQSWRSSGSAAVTISAATSRARSSAVSTGAWVSATYSLRPITSTGCARTRMKSKIWSGT